MKCDGKNDSDGHSDNISDSDSDSTSSGTNQNIEIDYIINNANLDTYSKDGKKESIVGKGRADRALQDRKRSSSKLGI